MALKMNFILAGLPDLMNSLEDLTPELVNEVEKMQAAYAEAAADKIRGLYVYKTGDLVKGVRVRRLLKGRNVAATVVENTHWLASIYEHGSKTVRETKAGYSRGQMPARPVFYRTMNETHYTVQYITIDILRRHGLVVAHAA